MKDSNVLSPSCGTVLRECNKALTNLGYDGNKTVFHFKKKKSRMKGPLTRGTWKVATTHAPFAGISSHSVTSVAPGVVVICGGEDGPRTLVPPIQSLWKYADGELKLIPQDEANAVTLLGHCSFGVNGQLLVCKYFA
jgi:hypothetical protein